MKIRLVTLFFFVLCLASCQQENKLCPDGLMAGQIFGIDPSECACCGGWWIAVDSDTLRAFLLPESIEINALDIANGVPIPICLSYEKSADCDGWEELIEIEEIILQE